MAEQPGMTDEQVEELVHALLDFRSMLVSLTDRFQNRLALLEQEFADYRSDEPAQIDGSTPLQSLKQRPGTAPLEMPNIPESLEVPDLLADDDAFSPEDTDAFAIVDLDDDDF